VKAREEVRWFADEHMERRLAEHEAFKKNWKSVSTRFLANRLQLKIKQVGLRLEDVLNLSSTASRDPEIESEDVMLYTMELLDACADTANYAMMVADNVRSSILIALEDSVTAMNISGEEEGNARR